nr:hypothetical protein [Tanacetum cinerariifolium]
MTSLADKAILSGANNLPPMLEKDMYHSWKSRMELYMLNKKHGRIILESVENDPLLWPTVEENGVTRLKKYSKLSTTEAIQADHDVKATNIILQGLPPEVYASVTMKFLNTLPPEWNKFVTDVKLVRDLHTTNVDQLHTYLGQHEYHANEVRLMHERTSDPFAFVAHHQMNKSTYQQHQQSYHQHQFQPQASTYQSSQYGTPYHSPQYASQAPSTTPLSLTYPWNDFQSSVNHNVYYPSSSMPHVEYAPAAHLQSVFSPPDIELVVLVFQKGNDPIDAINQMMSFLTSVVTSRYPATNNQLKTLSNPRQHATINNGRCTKPKRKRDQQWFKDKVLLVQAQANGQVLQEEELEFLANLGITETSKVHNQDNVYNNVLYQDISPALPDDLILFVIKQLKTQVVHCIKINQDNKNVNEILTAELERYKNQERILKEQNNFDKASASYEQSLEIEKLKHTLSEHLKEKESLEQKVTLLKNDFQKEESRNIYRELALEKQQLRPKLYDGSEIQKTDALVIHDSEGTLLLEDESQPNISASTTIVEVPKELPKVSMVISSLKKLKFHLASFDMVLKERTTATTITEGTWGFEHTKACFRDEIIPFVKALKELFNSFDQFLIDELTEVQNVFKQTEQDVEQHCVEKNKFQDKMKNILKDNDRLLEQEISIDIVNIVVHDHVNSACKNVNVCERCVTIETELQKDLIKKECYDMLFKKYNTLKKHCIP